MTGPLPLPVPTVVIDPNSEFENGVQQDLDAVANAVGDAPVLNAGDTAGGDLTGTFPNPTVARIRGKAITALNWGTGTVVFSASDASAQLSVAHGLGTTPALVVCTAKSLANARVTIQETASADATNFYVKGFQTANTSISLSQSFYWLAIA